MVCWPDQDRVQWQEWRDEWHATHAPDAVPTALAVVPSAAPLPAAPELLSHQERAEALYTQRRTRSACFGSATGLFQEPAWDMLLHLFIQQERGERVPISNLSLASCVPQTTALRWIKVLEKEGLICSWPSKSDARVRYIGLTPETHARMIHYLDRV